MKTFFPPIGLPREGGVGSFNFPKIGKFPTVHPQSVETQKLLDLIREKNFTILFYGNIFPIYRPAKRRRLHSISRQIVKFPLSHGLDTKIVGSHPGKKSFTILFMETFSHQ